MTAAHLIPLLDLSDPGAPLIRHGSTFISRARFAAAVLELAARLPAHGQVLNTCHTRLGFCVTLAASALADRTCLLAGHGGSHGVSLHSDGHPEPDITVLNETAEADIQVPTTLPTRSVTALPPIPTDRVVAVVHTSGSTGQPRAHAKTWHALWHAGRQIAGRLLPPSACIVATVPMHHMYGLETSVALPLVALHCVNDTTPVFPKDIRNALEAAPGPRVLVTTPVHLRALLNAGTSLPSLSGIISATAPLPASLAARAEAAFDTPVHEIYGCTEAGSIASRHSVVGASWTPFGGIHLDTGRKHPIVRGIHLDGSTPLHDRIRLQPDGKFRLLGRDDDLAKVGGKRASLTDLTHKLLSIPGVVDGIVFQPENGDEGIVTSRLAALAVAPELSENQILTALSRLVDPVFLPRPLRKLPALPRNATGKLPRDTLQRLLANG